MIVAPKSAAGGLFLAVAIPFAIFILVATIAPPPTPRLRQIVSQTISKSPASPPPNIEETHEQA